MGELCGGASGLVSSVRSFESGDTTNLQLNRVLNESSHASQARGKQIGIIRLIYADMESGIMALRDSLHVGR